MNSLGSRGSFGCRIAFVAFLLAAPSFAATPLYSLTDLGVLGSPVINNHGLVAGLRSTNNGVTIDLILYSNGVTTDLGSLPGSPTEASVGAMSNSGQIVGYTAYIASPAWLYHAFLWDGSTLTQIGPLGGTNSEAFGINDGGQVVGFSDTSNGTSHAFLDSGGAMNDLGCLPGGSVSLGYHINNAGQIVGSASTNGNKHYDAFLYSAGTMNDLGNLGGGNAEGHGVNDYGQVVGWGASAPSPHYTHAFLYSGGVMNDLGTLPGCVYSQANAINNSGQIAGYSATSSFTYRAMLYSGGTMTDLNSLIDPGLGWTLQQANSINDQGQIVGNGRTAAGEPHAFLLTPTLTLQISLSQSNLVQVHFTAQANTGYYLEYRDSLSSGAWHLLVVMDPVTFIHTVSFTDPVSPGTTRFYRARTR
jgi:probable HAF family extracellular repeat protein